MLLLIVTLLPQLSTLQALQLKARSTRDRQENIHCQSGKSGNEPPPVLDVVPQSKGTLVSNESLTEHTTPTHMYCSELSTKQFLFTNHIKTKLFPQQKFIDRSSAGFRLQQLSNFHMQIFGSWFSGSRQRRGKLVGRREGLGPYCLQEPQKQCDQSHTENLYKYVVYFDVVTIVVHKPRSEITNTCLFSFKKNPVWLLQREGNEARYHIQSDQTEIQITFTSFWTLFQHLWDPGHVETINWPAPRPIFHKY